MLSRSFFCLVLGVVLFYGELLSQDYRIAFIPRKETNWGFMNLKGEVFVPPVSGIGLPGSPDGVVLVTETGFPNSPCSMFDLQGQEIFPPVKLRLVIDQPTGEVSGIRSGMIRQVKKGKWGAVNTKGILTVPFLYDELTDFEGGYALGKRDDNYYVVDVKGHEHPVEQSSEITFIMHFSEGVAAVKIKRKGFGFVNTLGKTVIEPKYISVGYFKGGFAWAMEHPMRYGYIDHSGDWISDPIFNIVNDFDPVSGLAMVRIKATDLWASYVDTTGKVITFRVAEKYDRFSEGLAPALLKGKYGYLNPQGLWAIVPAFDEVAHFSNGYAAAKFDGYWGLIDTTGQWVLQPNYKQIGPVIKLDVR